MPHSINYCSIKSKQSNKKLTSHKNPLGIHTSLQTITNMSPCYTLQINLNEDYTFFLNQDIISKHSGTLRKMIKQSKKNRNKKLKIDDFPGGPNGFELVSRFCYNNGEISINVSNVSTLYCSSIFLNMTNLLLKTEKFLQETIYGSSWTDVVSCLKNCEQVFLHAESYGLIDKLVFVALTNIEDSSSSSSSSLASTRSCERSNERNVSCGRSNEWWFEDMSSLSTSIILKVVKIIGDYETNISGLVLTRFLLHYLKTKLQTKVTKNKLECSVLADNAVKGVIYEGKTMFSCRKLFWVLRVLSRFRLSKESKMGLETLIGEMLDQATLDDLLITSRGGGSKDSGGYYNVDLVIRLLKVFVKKGFQEEGDLKMRDIGVLVDKYLIEISPDLNLKVSKFLGVAESLPDSARDCFDGIYRAIDIYLQSHPNLTTEDRTKLCRCLNYNKLTMETCKQIARNPKIPPDIAIEALKSKCDNQEHKTPVSKVARSSFSCRYSEETKKPVLLHLKGFEISEKSPEGLKSSSRGFSWRVMDSFRESS